MMETLPVMAQGVFDGHGDIGRVSLPGSVILDPTGQNYNIRGSGANMWAEQDAFYFVWKKISGDFIVRAHARFIGTGVDPHRKMGWMIRTSLEYDAAYVDATVHGDGLTAMQFRRSRGMHTEEHRSSVKMPEVIQLARHGNAFTMSVAVMGDTLEDKTLTGIDLGDSVFVGLFVCAHNDTVIEEAEFENVRIIIPAREGFVPYKDYLGSNLELLEVSTGKRTIVFQDDGPVQAPNWTTDGQALIYNRDGHLYRFDLQRKQPRQIDAGFATANNNDHVLSFDGSMLGISHHPQENGYKSVIYVLPVSGGTPEQITPLGPSYLHGWSPDGKYLVYTGERNGEFDIYKVPVAGGEEVRLTTADGLDDGPEYTPDGRYIYFNSVRSGRMEIWRMRPDGTQQEQITDDNLNNWFPHISPDGKWVVFLSFRPDVAPDAHPYYRQVYIRIMPAYGGEAKVIAYVYGGQGTINVPSWSPDSRRVAFVSNTNRE
jgi:Tol biopolymer transport system component